MDSGADRFTNVAELLDVFFGGTWGPASVDRLPDSKLDMLADEVNAFYETYSPPPVGPGTYRCYSGGATFLQPRSLFLPFARSAILYAHEVVMNCPLDEWVWRRQGFRVPTGYRAAGGAMSITPSQPGWINEPGYWESSYDNRRKGLSEAVAALSDYESAIRAGWIVLIPRRRYWKKNEQGIWSQVRRDVNDRRFQELLAADYSTPVAVSDNLRGMAVVPGVGWDKRDHARAEGEAPSLYFNGTLATAGMADAHFLPIADSDFALFRHKLEQAQAMSRELREALLIHAVDEVLMPAVNEETISTISDIRRSEQSFAEWRDELEGLISGRFFSSDLDLREVQSLTLEIVQDKIESIRREIASSSALARRFSVSRMEAIDLGVAAALWLIPGEVLTKAIGSLAALLKFAVKAATPERTGRASVLLQLDRTGVTQTR